MLRTVAFLSAFLASGFLFAKTPNHPAQPPPKPFVLLDIPACADRAKIDDMISHVTQKTQFQTDNQYNIATSQNLMSVFGSTILSESTCSPQASPHFQTSPKVAVKALFWRNNSAYLATRGRSRQSGMLGMRS